MNLIPEPPIKFNDDFLQKKIAEWTYKTADALFLHNIDPLPGSVVYCNLAIVAEHTGIYIGKNKIVHLEGSGMITIVSPGEFCQRLEGRNPSFTIFCPVDKNVHPIGNKLVAKRALTKVGEKTDYNLLSHNCHCFVAECLLGQKNNCHSFTLLESILRQQFGMAYWRATKLNH